MRKLFKDHWQNEKFFQIACAIATVLAPQLGWNPLLILICIHSAWRGSQQRDFVVRLSQYGFAVVLFMIIVFNMYNAFV